MSLILRFVGGLIFWGTFLYCAAIGIGLFAMVAIDAKDAIEGAAAATGGFAVFIGALVALWFPLLVGAAMYALGKVLKPARRPVRRHRRRIR